MLTRSLRHTTRSAHRRATLPTMAALALAAGVTGCGLGKRVAESAIPLEEEQVEELATFQCVTAQAAVQLRERVTPEAEEYEAGALLYEGTRELFNPVIEGIARDMERGRSVDVAGYWERLATARERQQDLLAYVEEEASGFGFVGLDMLAAVAAPYARRMVRRYMDQKIRAYAADHLRDEMLLPPIDSAHAACAEETTESETER